jgi:threonyl-tRNA synthetase
MLRVRGFTQDDAHVFCTDEQVEIEIGRLLDLVDEMLAVFGYPYSVELSTRPETSLGTPEQWVKLIDAIGRKWQGPTVQLDFNLPERFGLEYIGADNAAHRPFMLHRVLVGSMERFVGGLIEHYAGAFPVWLAPEQVRVIPISDENVEVCRQLTERLKQAGIRAQLDARSETLNYRIRDGEVHKVPYMAVVGKREAEGGTIALRVRGTGKKQEIVDVGAFIERVKGEIASRALTPNVMPAATADA